MIIKPREYTILHLYSINELQLVQPVQKQSWLKSKYEHLLSGEVESEWIVTSIFLVMSNEGLLIS